MRELLRYGGYKPTGRGKPASEYLVRAAGEGHPGLRRVGVEADPAYARFARSHAGCEARARSALMVVSAFARLARETTK